MKPGGIFADMHTHSRNSHDGVATVAQMAQMQIKNGSFAFAVTDHFDSLYENDLLWKRLDDSRNETLKTRADFADKIKILFGIEMGESIDFPDVAQKALDKYKNDYDVVLGSVHTISYKNTYVPYSQIDFSGFSADDVQEFLKIYFDDVLKTAQTLDFDILTHITCPVRYISGKYGKKCDISLFEKKICEILDVIIERGIALEINTSCINALIFDFMPDENIVRMYKNRGGMLVTLGSDAHIADNTAVGFEKAAQMLKNIGFDKCCYFEKRQLNFFEI